MTATLQQVVESLSSTGLMSEAEVEQFIHQLPPESRPGDSAALLGELVQRRRLTRFQADALTRGAEHPLVLGDHVVLDRLGAGGMGVVYKARNRRMDRVVALKVLPAEATRSPASLERFLREVKAAARLNHRNIVTTYHADEHHGTHYLVMEYIEGGDLLRCVRGRGPFSVVEAVGLITQAARGLQYAHTRNVVHRDVKPSNLLLGRDGTLKILDLGLARVVEGSPHHAEDASVSPSPQEDLTVAGEAMGTYGYIAPEQADDARHADHRADIYSLGCTLYFLLTGKTMYSGNSSEIVEAHRREAIPSLCVACAEVTPELDAVFRRMVAKLPDERYASMVEVIEALGPFRDPAVEGDGSSVVDFSVLEDSEQALTEDLDARLVDSTNTLASREVSTRGSRRLARSAAAPQALPRPLHRRRLVWLAAACALLLAALAVLLAAHWLARGGNGQAAGRGTPDESNVTAADGGGAASESANADTTGGKLPPTGANAATGISAEPPVVSTAAFSPAQARTFQDETARRLGCEAELTNSIEMQFILIPAHRRENGEIVAPYYLGMHEVTQDDYAKVMLSNPSAFAKGGAKQAQLGGVANTARFPVENVTRDEALEFCEQLSRRAEENEAGRVYRLPTIEEWQFACRAGGAGKFGVTDDPAALHEFAWYDRNSDASLKTPQPVGLLKPNAFGLYDMLGNVCERASDEDGGRFPMLGASFYDWLGKQTPEEGKLMNEPYRAVDYGFRVVCLTPQLRRTDIAAGDVEH